MTNSILTNSITIPSPADILTREQARGKSSRQYRIWVLSSCQSAFGWEHSSQLQAFSHTTLEQVAQITLTVTHLVPAEDTLGCVGRFPFLLETKCVCCPSGF